MEGDCSSSAEESGCRRYQKPLCGSEGRQHRRCQSPYRLDDLVIQCDRPRLKKPTLDPDDVNAYRPISNRTFLSKLFYGSPSLTSCRTTASPSRSPVGVPTLQFDRTLHHWHARQDRQDGMDSGNVCAVVQMDLNAAFDTVDHQILLQMLNSRRPSKECCLIGASHNSGSVHKHSA